MLTRLVRDHRGLSACFYYDLGFEDTVRRHATKAKSTEFGPDLMADWFRLRDLVPALNESILGPEVTLDAATSTVMRAVSLREVEKGADQ